MKSVFPKIYDIAMKPLEATRFKKVRTELIRHAQGNVLEIGSGTGINFPYYADHTFDTVISTLVFCTIPNPLLALKEIQRVSKPGATILFFEHVKMKQPNLAKAQDLVNPLWEKVCDGCQLN